MQYICRVGKESFHTDSLLKCEQFFLGFGIQFFGKSPVKFKKISDQVVEYKFGLSPHSRKDLIGKSFTILGVSCRIKDVIKVEWNNSCKSFFYRVEYTINPRGRKIYKMWVLHRDFE